MFDKEVTRGAGGLFYTGGEEKAPGSYWLFPPQERNQENYFGIGAQGLVTKSGCM